MAQHLVELAVPALVPEALRGLLVEPETIRLLNLLEVTAVRVEGHPLQTLPLALVPVEFQIRLRQHLAIPEVLVVQ